MSAVLKFLAAARSLANQGLSKKAIEQFAKNEFGEINELLQRQIDNIFKPGKGITSIKKDPDFDDTVIQMQIDEFGPFNPKDPLKNLKKQTEGLPSIKKDKPPKDEKAQGGRIGLKDGMSRRKFMQIMGGLAAIPIVGKFFKVGKVAAPTVEKVIEKASTSDVPPYFLNLVNKIKNLGQKFDGPTERSESFLYKDYSMDIDLDTGKIDIKKTREAMIPGSDEAGIAEEVYMTYKPGMADETTKGKKVVDEYEEFTARPDIDGKMKDVDEGVPDEVIEEGTMFEDNMTEFGKASGGIARMLGE